MFLYVKVQCLWQDPRQVMPNNIPICQTAPLQPEMCKAILEKLDMEILRFVANDPECDSASVLMIKKT